MAATAPIIAGYAFEQSADLTNPQIRERLSGSALKAFLKITAMWQVNEPQVRGLLGGIASSTFHTWKNEPAKQKLTQDTLTRISLVIGIYKALHIYFGEEWADRWVTLGNRGPLFAGAAPLDYMIRHGQPGMVQVRQMLDAWHGGH